LRPSHGENRGSSPLGSAIEINYLVWFALGLAGFAYFLSIIRGEKNFVRNAHAIQRARLAGSQTKHAAEESVASATCAQFEHDDITVGRWEHYYGFRIGDQKFDQNPYGHTETLTWHGNVIRPECFRYTKAEVTLSARDGLMSERATPRSIGTLNPHDGVVYAYVFVPAEHMGQLIALAASGWVHELKHDGYRLWRGKRGVAPPAVHRQRRYISDNVSPASNSSCFARLGIGVCISNGDKLGMANWIRRIFQRETRPVTFSNFLVRL
jgi:hypothetical protein